MSEGKWFQPAWNDPSSFSSVPPTAPASGVASRKSTSASSDGPLTIVSLLSSSTYGAVVHAIPWLLALPRPTFPSFWTRCTDGNSSRSIAWLPSVEPLSTTTTWQA